MDVKEGCCWRCYTALSKTTVNCGSCGIAEYCSNKCKENDQTRHKSVECPTWSAKPCAACKKVGAKNECSGCYSVWYCNKDCQLSDWAKHKPVCRKWQKIVEQVGSRPFTFMGDYPFYFSNSFPNDLLNIQNNEMKGKQGIQATFNILLPACGDLLHMMKTVESQPKAFTSSLKFVLNDIDPFTMARNVLLLFLMFTCEAKQVSTVSTIWLSLQLPLNDYLLLREKLSNLIEMDSSRLKKITGGMIDVNEQSYKVMREVWSGWVKYPCEIKNGKSDDIMKERKAIFDSDPGARLGLVGHLHDVPQQHVNSIKKWFDDGKILPGYMVDGVMTNYNPTFTGRGREPYFLATVKSPSSYNFSYCIRSDCIPYQIWDYLDLAQFKRCDSVITMCHEFTTHVVAKTRDMMRDRRLSIYICTEDFLELGSVIPGQVFDRIFASNLIDYYRISQTIEILEPFLSKTNPHAALFMETFNWFLGIDGAVWPTAKSRQMELNARGLKDCNLKIRDLVGRKVSCFHEYYDNTAYFINYLRGERHTGTKPIPKLSDVMNCHGLTMRDFRKGRNRVIPFNQRVAVRTVNMLNGDVRTLEWYRSNAE
ncbi:hypothetical protein BSL78_10886 [Apostichopus japonicus]|uniref:MYND-type domain-containing protein n=1 Tax=Stichopus japonicus TaxID=307972 RepID=A0A2G8KW39_STIJA|nr:hypothetical protein BSL78_10886 [Apostichopus japonicus]